MQSVQNIRKHRAEFGISILKEYWGFGIGRALINACVQCAKEAGYVQLELDVVADNTRAIALYQSVGFQEYGRNPKGFRSKTQVFRSLCICGSSCEHPVILQSYIILFIQTGAHLHGARLRL